MYLQFYIYISNTISNKELKKTALKIMKPLKVSCKTVCKSNFQQNPSPPTLKPPTKDCYSNTEQRSPNTLRDIPFPLNQNHIPNAISRLRNLSGTVCLAVVEDPPLCRHATLKITRSTKRSILQIYSGYK